MSAAPTKPRQPLMTPDEVAEVLHVPRKTVMNLSRRGEFPRLKIGQKTVRFDFGDIEAYLQRTKSVGRTS